MLQTGSFGSKGVKMIPSRSPRGILGYIYLFIVAYPLSFGSEVIKMRLVSTLKRVEGAFASSMRFDPGRLVNTQLLL